MEYSPNSEYRQGSTLPPLDQRVAVNCPGRPISDTILIASDWRSGGLFWLVVVLALPLSISALGHREGYVHQHVASLVLQYIVVAYAGTRLAVIFAGGQQYYIQIVFWFFTYVWMGLAPLAQVISDRYPLPLPFAAHVVRMAPVIVVIGLLAYDLGSATSRRWHNRGGPVTAWLSKREISVARVVLLGLAVILATPMLVQRLGGLNVQFTSREAEIEALTSAGLLSESSKAAGGLYKALATIPAFMALYALWMVRQHRHRRGEPMTVGLLTMLVLLFAVNIIVNNPISNPRIWFGTIAISLVLLGRFGTRPQGIRLLIIGLLLGGVVVFPYADYFRYTYTRHQTVVGVSETLVTNGDYDAMQMTQASVDYSERFGHTSGRQALGALFFWYPRSWWPAKPNDTGVMLGEYYNSPNTNLSSPLWGEMYLDFGFPGVLVAFFILGFASTNGDRLLTEGLALAKWQSLFRLAVPLMACYQVIIIRGSLLQSLHRAAVILVIASVITRRTRQP